MSTDKNIENTLEKYNHLIGKILSGSMITKIYTVKGTLREMKHFKLSEESIEFLKKQTLPEHLCRIIMTSYVSTRDYNINRVNYQVSDAGIIEKIYFG